MGLHLGPHPVLGKPSLCGRHIKVSPRSLMLKQCHFAPPSMSCGSPWSTQCSRRDPVLILREPRLQPFVFSQSLCISLSLPISSLSPFPICHLSSPRELCRMGVRNLYKVNLACRHNLSLKIRMSRGVTQLVQCWPSMYEALGSAPSTDRTRAWWPTWVIPALGEVAATSEIQDHPYLQSKFNGSLTT